MKLAPFLLTITSLVVAQKLPQNCEEIYRDAARKFESAKSGVHKIYPTRAKDYELEVLCDMDTNGGGWTVIQLRFPNDKLDFNRNWTEYKNGFGTKPGSHWIGLDTISKLTKSGKYILHIHLLDWDGEIRYAEYREFRVASSTQMYKLTVGEYHGNAGDSLGYHNGKKFTTKDVDNDELGDGRNCAVMHESAWWFGSCYSSNLNGVYGANDTRAITWEHWKGKSYGLKAVAMKIRTTCHEKIMEEMNDCVVTKHHRRTKIMVPAKTYDEHRKFHQGKVTN